MTANLDLWNWFIAATQPGRRSTAEGLLTIWDADASPRITFGLEQCLPIKMRGPSLNAKDGMVAIEEMQLVYETLTIRTAGQAGTGLGGAISLGGAAGGAAAITASVSAGLSAGASLSVSGGPGLSGSVGASFSMG